MEKRMSSAEIVIYLNSGCYIPIATRQMLENKIKTDRKFTPLDEFFALIAPSKPSKSSKPAEAFPELQKSNTPPISDTFQLDYTSVKSEIKPIRPTDNIIISYKHVQKMQQDCAIYRIRLQYLVLSKKINLLNNLASINPTRGKKFKEHFNYSNMIKELYLLKNCIGIHTELRALESKKLSEEKCTYLKNLLDGGLKKYRCFLIPDQVINCDKMMMRVTDFCDPNIECDYHITLNLKNPEENPIVMRGLSTSIYLSCDDEINLLTKNGTGKMNHPNILRYITLKELERYFEKKKVRNDGNIFYLYSQNSPIYIHYYQNIFVKIVDLPVGMSILSSMSSIVPDQNTLVKPIVPMPSARFDNNTEWFNTRHKLYRLTEQEYEELDPEWKQYYTLDDTGRNSFKVNYLFYELLKNDSMQLVESSMLDSFKRLALDTSTIYKHK